MQSEEFISGQNVTCTFKEIEQILKSEYKKRGLIADGEFILPSYFHFAKIYYRDANAIHEELKLEASNERI